MSESDKEAMELENILISKLDEFIRKYYTNKIIRGSLITGAILVTLFLAEIFLEHFNYFNSLARQILFWFYLLAAAFSITLLIILPMLKLFRIGKRLSYKQAAVIIGEHFGEIGDKLLNTLQLIEQREGQSQNLSLLVAGIEQKIQKIRPLPFRMAISFRTNFRFLPYVLPPLLILFILLLTAPTMVSEPTHRLIHYKETFTPPALFRISVLNKSLKAMQQDDFLLKINVNGEVLPDEILLKTETSVFPMKKESNTTYSYQFKSLQSSFSFCFLADDLKTGEYTLEVYPKPIILQFEARLTYPGYTGKPEETLESIGDMTIPEGTVVSWTFQTRDVTAVHLKLGESEINLKKAESNSFTYSQKFFESIGYMVSQENQYLKKSDSLLYRMNVIKDAYPEITYKETGDSTLSGRVFFSGIIKDDYGFTRLVFSLNGKKPGDSVYQLLRSDNIEIEKNNVNQNFYHDLDVAGLKPGPGEKFSYYFEIWDNDGINGPKSSRTYPVTVEVPTLEEIARNTDKAAEGMLKDLEKSKRDSREMGKSIDELQKKLIDQDNVSFKEKKKIEEVIGNAEKIQSRAEEFKQKNAEKLKDEKAFLETSERILEKQQKLNELAEQLMTDEMKKTLQEMKMMLEKMDKNKMNELLPKLKKQNEQLEQELDRNIQLFKQLEFERKLEQQINQMNKLSEEQEKLGLKTDEKKEDKDALIEAQKKLELKFDSINRNLQKLSEDAKHLETAPDLESTEKERSDISNEIQKSLEELSKDKPGNASKSQKKASEKMKELSDNLAKMMSESEQEQNEEDILALRLLLQNLNKLSLEQEDMIKKTTTINRNDPKYLAVIDEQQNMQTKFKVLDDTLRSLAGRQVMMKGIISRMVENVKENLNQAERGLVERNTAITAARQQYVMTGMNDLANLLKEFLSQMEEQLNNAQSSEGQKSCKKPGKPGGKQSMKTMRQLQQELSNKLQQMKQNQGVKGKGKPSDRGEENRMNKEIAKMAAEQEAIRKAMQEYENALKEEGSKDNSGMNSAIQEMENNEKDILNKRISQETINRQQRILSRMLESEKAEQQREKDEKRESIEEKNQLFSNPMTDFEYKKKQSTGQDVLNFRPLPVNYYYKRKSAEYFLKLGN